MAGDEGDHARLSAAKSAHNALMVLCVAVLSVVMAPDPEPEKALLELRQLQNMQDSLYRPFCESTVQFVDAATQTVPKLIKDQQLKLQIADTFRLRTAGHCPAPTRTSSLGDHIRFITGRFEAQSIVPQDSTVLAALSAASTSGGGTKGSGSRTLRILRVRNGRVDDTTAHSPILADKRLDSLNDHTWRLEWEILLNDPVTMITSGSVVAPVTVIEAARVSSLFDWPAYPGPPSFLPRPVANAPPLPATTRSLDILDHSTIEEARIKLEASRENESKVISLFNLPIPTKLVGLLSPMLICVGLLLVGMHLSSSIAETGPTKLAWALIYDGKLASSIAVVSLSVIPVGTVVSATIRAFPKHGVLIIVNALVTSLLAGWTLVCLTRVRRSLRGAAKAKPDLYAVANNSPKA